MSNNNIQIGVIMSLVDRFSGNSKRINNAFTGIGRHGQRVMRGLSASANMMGRTLDSIGNRYTGLLTGAAGIGAIRSVAVLDKRLVYLGIQAGKTDKQIAQLRDTVFSIAQENDIRLDPAQLLDAVDKIVEKTGDFDLAESNIRNIGLAVRAANAQGLDIGALIADLNEKFDIGSGAEMLEVLDLLVNQGKAGAFTLQNLATQGERVTAAYAATGRVGVPAVREMGAMLQQIKKGTGSPEQAATAFEALLRTLNDADKRKLLTKNGIKLMDPDDPKRLRAVTEIVKDMIKATGGDIAKLSEVFDGEAIRALTSVAAEYQKTGGFASLDGFLNQAADGKQITEDAARGVRQLEGSLTGLSAAWKRYSFNKISGPMREIVDAINSIDAAKLEKVIDIAVKGGVLLGGAIAARKVQNRFFGGSGVAAGLAGAASSLKPIPVWVVNNVPGKMPGSITGKFGSAAGGAGVAAGASRFARFGSAGRALLRFGAPIVAAGHVYDYGAGMATGDTVRQSKASGALSGGALGAGAGAVAGSVVPVVGTLVGAAVGGLIGMLAGGKLGETLQQNKVDKNNLDVRISVDQEGRVKDVTTKGYAVGGVMKNVDVGPILRGM